MQSQQIDISKLRPNTGQIEGVPGNPRFIRDERFEKLKESIRADPEMMQVREIVAYDNGGELVIIMGNMRYRAAKALGIKEVPVKILPQDTPAKKLQAYIIKDNVPFGETDWDMLANEWDTAELEEWGMELPVQWEDDSGNDGGGKTQSPQVSFTMSPEQEEVLRRCIEAAKTSELYKQTPFFGNRSEDGNALYLIAVQWEEFQKTARGGGN